MLVFTYATIHGMSELELFIPSSSRDERLELVADYLQTATELEIDELQNLTDNLNSTYIDSPYGHIKLEEKIRKLNSREEKLSESGMLRLVLQQDLPALKYITELHRLPLELAISHRKPVCIVISRDEIKYIGQEVISSLESIGLPGRYWTGFQLYSYYSVQYHEGDYINAEKTNNMIYDLGLMPGLLYGIRTTKLQSKLDHTTYKPD